MPYNNIQSVAFSKSYGWTVPKAKIWLDNNNLKLLSGKSPHINKTRILMRITNPSKHKRYATKKLSNGINLILTY